MDWIALIAQGESKTLELKEQLPKNNSIAKTAIAFANTAGGRLIIGVNDALEIVGVNEDSIFPMQEKVSSLIHDLCHPNIIPEMYTVRVETKIIFVVEIFRGNLLPYWFKPKGLQEGTYLRIGSSNRIADEIMIAELQRQRMHKSFDEEPNGEYTVDDLDVSVIYDAFSDIGKRCDMTKLKNLKLITEFQGRLAPANALLIALGKLDNVRIKCARFKGTTMESFIDKKELEGTLFEMLEQSMAFLQNHLHLHARIEGLKRTEEYEIPLPALREILLNAIIHRDYTRNSDIKIAIYDDMVEVISVGGLVNGLTIDDIGNGRSELRNKVLANLFRELGYIESWGSGIGRVRAVCQEAEVNFALREQGSFVEAVFYRNRVETEPERTKTVDYGRLRSITVDSHRSIAEYIIKNGRITRKATIDLLGIGRTKADEILSDMLASGLIVRKGAGRATHYVLASQMNMENGQ
jgi:ATP-dependent DNA helicase RecG